MQFVSLLLSFAGLWWTARGIDKCPLASETKLPVLFWVQLPIDLGRIGFWFVQVCIGFSNSKRFSWFSVVLWLVPFNYFWLVRLLGSKRIHQPQYPVQPYEAGAEDSTKASGSRDLKILGASVIFGFITVIQWCMSLAVAGTHFSYSMTSKERHPTYFQVDRALTPQSSIAPMPQECLKWLQNSSNIMPIKKLDVSHVQIIHTFIVAFQFIACSAMVVLKHNSRHHVLDKLRSSATAIFITFALPALATGIWILVTTTIGEQRTWLTYTTDRNLTGGCTFGMVNMNRQWGYWDVEYQRPIRIAMSVLGVA
ncbi:hypothetical protein GQ44DRAFT_777638 [Phaeosphaeriaceae sp. PMI808]|nr:hypothetical protein GQ44DRAFT_777638 [Phaeosphaeriaceae sp. PMI808]